MDRRPSECSARLLGLGSCFLLIFLAFALSSLGQHRHVNSPKTASVILLQSPSGKLLPSTFEDLQSTLKLSLWKKAVAKGTTSSRKCSNNIFVRAERKAERFLGLDATVYAQGCNGCYNSVIPATCGGDCGQDPDDEYDPENPTGGVYYAGDYACTDCGEMLPLYAGCTNPYC
jgi:hypothetical protein